MRFMTKLVLLGGAAYGAKWAYDKYVAAGQQLDAMSTTGAQGAQARIGYDTPTGTDPSAKYSTPGYEDKSFGQAVDQDQQLVDRLVENSNSASDLDNAADVFRRSSAGSPALERQEGGAQE